MAAQGAEREPNGSRGLRGVGWRSPASALGGGATGAALAFGLQRADPIVIIGGVATWALLSLGTMAGGAVALWATRTIIHGDELKEVIRRQQDEIVRLVRERERREIELMRDRQIREDDLIAREREWKDRFFTAIGIADRATQQSAHLAAATAALVEQTHAPPQPGETPRGGGDSLGTSAPRAAEEPPHERPAGP